LLGGDGDSVGPDGSSLVVLACEGTFTVMTIPWSWMWRALRKIIATALAGAWNKEDALSAVKTTTSRCATFLRRK
jgi:hypothetical protein